MRYISGIFSSFITFSLLWIALVYLQIGNPTQTSKWLDEAYQLKESTAQSITAKKVVITSGSNALFGFNSPALEKKWDMPVINGSVHAGLGLQYILHRSKKILNRGDIVILPLEYAFYQEDGKPSEVYADFILSRDEEYFNNLALSDRLIIISRVSFSRLYEGLKYFFNEELIPTKGLYGIQNIDRYGDQINLEPWKITTMESNSVNRIAASEILSSDLTDHFIETMNDYITWARSNDICIISMPPNFMFFAKYRDKKYADFYSNIKSYYAGKDVAFKGSVYDYMFEKEFYFNTAYHLNSTGVNKRTDQVIEDLGNNPQDHCKDI